MRHARRHTRTKTPKRVLALPDLEQAKSAVLSSAGHQPRLSLLRWGCTTLIDLEARLAASQVWPRGAAPRWRASRTTRSTPTAT